MTTNVTRARLLSTVLRTGDARRIRRLVDRLERRDLAGVLPALSHLDLRRLATALFDEERVAHTIAGLNAEGLARLLLAAHASDARTLLRRLADDDGELATATLLALPTSARMASLQTVDGEARAALVRRLPRRARPTTHDETLGAALRLRRIFA